MLLFLSISTKDILFGHIPYILIVYECYDLLLSVLCTNIDEMQVVLLKIKLLCG